MQMVGQVDGKEGNENMCSVIGGGKMLQYCDNISFCCIIVDQVGWEQV